MMRCIVDPPCFGRLKRLSYSLEEFVARVVRS